MINKTELYKTLIKSHQDKNGFIETDHCDSLLFSGLLSCVGGIEIKLEAARDSSGQWYRRPQQNCFPHGSKSTISRDMLLGLLWGAYFNKRLDIIEQVIKYATDHALMMGDAVNLKVKFGRCLMTPSLLGLYAEASYALGGPNRFLLRKIPASLSTNMTGFQAHLTVLNALLRKEITGTEKYNKLLNIYANKNKFNPLFQYAADNLIMARDILDNESLWPKDRLPTRLDRKSSWVLERDNPADWQPAITDTHKEHTGGDYLFVDWLLRSEDF